MTGPEPDVPSAESTTWNGYSATTALNLAARPYLGLSSLLAGIRSSTSNHRRPRHDARLLDAAMRTDRPPGGKSTTGRGLSTRWRRPESGTARCGQCRPALRLIAAVVAVLVLAVRQDDAANEPFRPFASECGRGAARSVAGTAVTRDSSRRAAGERRRAGDLPPPGSARGNSEHPPTSCVIRVVASLARITNLGSDPHRQP